MTLSPVFRDRLKAIERRYRAVFSLDEYDESLALRWAFGALVFAYYVAFVWWTSSDALTIQSAQKGVHVCWPYFQECGSWYFLQTLPHGYLQTILYMGLFGLLVHAVYRLSRREWALAQLSLLIPFLWHFIAVFVLSVLNVGNYHYYLFFFGLILLFFPHKEFFLKLCIVLFYFLSTIAKLHESWVLGTYFSSLKTGLPLFPEWSIPFWTNLVIFMEMVGAWLLLSKQVVLQRAVLIFFIAFHLYSGILVEYRYPSTVLPMLIIMFGPFYRYSAPPLDRRSLIGWGMVLCMFLLQISPKLIPGDEKLTHEGNKYGLYMFESNHQCVSSTRRYWKDGSVTESTGESEIARVRCDPYTYWFRLKQFCARNKDSIERVEWTFDHSINGAAFLRIVEERDACALTYRPFGRNTWIKTDKDNPAVIGYPVENTYE